ncbi:MAG: LptA/OstA family protein [Kiritimatiellia bacterium]
MAAEQAARKKAEAEKRAAVQEAQAKMQAADAARTEAEAAMNAAVQTVRDEKAARARAEAAAVAAEARAEVEKKAAAKAVEAQAAAEKRVKYLMNPDPDERPRPKKLVAEGETKDVTETVVAGPAAKKEDGKQAKKPLTGREAVITAERTDYDRKEGVILFDRNVYVDDEQYQMHADRLFVFLDGTNELKRLVAIGNVAITNEERSASCARAVYTKAVSKIVMYGDENAKARLHEVAKRGDNDAQGDRITFWLNSEQVEIEGPVISVPGGALKGGPGKGFLQQMK